MNGDWLAVFEILKNVYTDGAYSNLAIEEALSHHKGCKESFVRNFAKGVLRSSIRLNYYIDRLASKGIDKVAPRPLMILRMGIYAIESLDSVPDHAAVSEAVNLSKIVTKGSDGFINAVLRSYIRQKDALTIPDDRLDLRYSVSTDIVELLNEQYGSETETILEAMEDPFYVIVRPNRLKIGKEEVIAALKDIGVDAEASNESKQALIARGSGIVESDLYKKGCISLQSLSSMMAIEALAPQAGSSVLDMCAAPGGKSAYMAELMDNKGNITACDIHPHRLGLIENSMKRLGIDIVDTRLSDGTLHDNYYDDSFDYVLADVPCSGLGVMASKPEIRFQSDPSSYQAYIETQKSILKNATAYARCGGIIEYSTCTLNKNENENVIESIMQSEEGSLLSVLEMKTLLPYNCKVGFFYALLEKKPH